MGVCKLIASGKWATNTNWENAAKEAKKPVVGEDVHIPAGKEVKIEAEAEARSLYVEGNAKVTGAQQLKLGNAEKPEGPAGNSWAVKVDSEAVVTSWTGKIVLTSTAAETQKVSFVPTSANELQIKTKSTAKYLLEAAFTSTNLSAGLKLEAETSFDSNGFNIKVQKFSTTSAAKKITLKLHASTVTITGETGFFEEPGTESTSEMSAATIVLEGKESLFTGLTGSYGTLTVTGKSCKASGAVTIGTLNVNNKGAGAGEGLKLAQGTAFTITTIATNGTEAERGRLESSEAGKVAKLEIPKQELAGTQALALKDMEVPAGKGPWYLTTRSKDETGNVTVGSTVFFESESSGVVGKATGTMLLTGTATGTASNVVSGKATGPLLLTGTSSATLRSVILGKATGELLLTGTSKAIVRAVVSGHATGTLLLTGTSKGSISGAVAGHATGAILLTGASKATLAAVVKGKATGPILLTGTATGQRISRITGSATGTLVLSGTSKATLHTNIVGKASGALLFGGSAHSSSVVSPALVRFTNWKAASVRATNYKAASVRTTNEKVASVRTTNQ